MSRFADRAEVLFIEEPEHLPGVSEPHLKHVHEGKVTVLTPVVPAGRFDPGFHDSVNSIVRDLVTAWCETHYPDARTQRSVVWYWTPMAWGAAPETLDDPLVVYDVMDELANFRFAPSALREHETALLSSADLVFTGGPSLYEARKDRHPSVHCFPSGVDAPHFRQGDDPVDGCLSPSRAKKPVIGFYGVLDERIDFDLVAGIAEQRPEWTLVMIGPVVKIDENALPRFDNICYPGMRDYAELPAYLAGFDVAILPFALNDATRFISPTKTLEYLAAGKLVVSTPIRDVVDLYGEVVEIAEDADGFVAAIESLVSMSPESQRARQRRANELVSRASWDTTVDRMWSLIEREQAAQSKTANPHAPVRTATPTLGTAPESAPI
jgi:UDP-galactopyranose mutase